MNPRTPVNVARYHLMDWKNFAFQSWFAQTIAFVVTLTIFARATNIHGQRYTGAVAAIYVSVCVIGATATSWHLPFALSMGMTRRSYYAGTALLAAAVAAVYGLALTLLQLIERASGGWGMQLHFFRVPYLLAGSWYLTWLTSFVGLSLMFALGMWFGIVYRRWGLTGLMSLIGAQAVALTFALLIISWAHSWHSVGHFFTTLTIEGLTGLLALLAAALLFGGYVTIRHATV
jgi:hypothetical protein